MRTHGEAERMEYKDYYKTLGVDKNASEKEIRQAYRRLARQYHPDVNPGNAQAEARFKEINEANEVLTDPEKRRKYDELGAAYQQFQRGGGDPSGWDWNRWAGQQGGSRVHVEYADLDDILGGAGGFSDFFQALFGGATQGRTSPRYNTRPQAGQDYEQEVQITLREAFAGTRRTVQKDGRRIDVKIPAGVKTGSKVRVAGEGGPGVSGGRAGDLYLKVQVLPDSVFTRDGDDLHTDVDVDVYTAVVGGTVVVPTLAGPVNLKIPPETQGGRSFRLRGKGMPRLGKKGEFGDLYAKVRLVLPDKLSEHEKEVLAELAAARK
jgi:curved DNA-binding protein